MNWLRACGLAAALAWAPLAAAGTWSVEPFGNDSALDWAAELESAKDFGPVEAALDAALAPGALDADAGALAVAAAEVLAKARGRGTQKDASTRAIDAWLAGLGREPSAALRAKAVRALERVQGSESELAQLWNQGDAAAWQRNVDALTAALE